MIPRTFPSTFASNGQQQMVVHFLTSVEGLARWSDYIPVKLAQGGPENSYSGCIDVVAISELTADTQAWKEYIPVYADSSATDAWTVNSVGYIPYNYALFADATMQLDLTNGAALDPRITFSRTTNATLTNSSGLIANAPMNLLTHSEQFDNTAWSKLNTTVTANTVSAPNASTTADTLTASAGAAVHNIQQGGGGSGTPLTISINAKAGTHSFLQLSQGSAGGLFANFDLSTGQIGTVGASATATITDAGNGWYRCTMTFTPGSAANMRVGLVTSATATYTESWTADGTESIFIWGAQLELGSTATTYNPTTVKNLLGFTENFDNAAWTKSNASISATKVDDIYGQPFAQQVTSSASNGTVLSTYTAVASTPYTFSIWMKRVTGTGNIDISADGTTWATQTLTSAWQRFSVTVSPTAGSKTPGVRIATSGDSIYIFGAQLSDSASVDPYVYQPVAAPTSTAYYGPRFDYDPVTLAPKGLLIEEQRTQLLLNSSMDGTSLATQNVTVAAVAHTLTFYGTGTVTLSGVSTAGPLVGTGAYPSRASLTFTPTAGTLTLTVTGTVQFAQLEAGAFATSFIPSAASQVTRAADSASMIGNNFARWYNQTEGTLFANYYQNDGLASGGGLLALSDNTNNNRILLTADGASSSSIQPGMYVTAAGASQVAIVAGTGTQNSFNKLTGAYATNDFACSFNGATVVDDASGVIPVVDRAYIGAGATGATPINGTIARIAYYNRRLANTELQAITS